MSQSSHEEAVTRNRCTASSFRSSAFSCRPARSRILSTPRVAKAVSNPPARPARAAMDAVRIVTPAVIADHLLVPVLGHSNSGMHEGVFLLNNAPDCSDGFIGLAVPGGSIRSWSLRTSSARGVRDQTGPEASGTHWVHAESAPWRVQRSRASPLEGTAGQITGEAATRPLLRRGSEFESPHPTSPLDARASDHSASATIVGPAPPATLGTQ